MAPSPDGQLLRILRIPAPKSLPLDRYFALDTANLNVNHDDRPPKQKPPPPDRESNDRDGRQRRLHGTMWPRNSLGGELELVLGRNCKMVS